MRSEQQECDVRDGLSFLEVCGTWSWRYFVCAVIMSARVDADQVVMLFYAQQGLHERALRH